jgi:hypothetical protein
MARSRLWKTTERLILGALMGTAAFLIERRLRKALRKMEEGEPRSRSATFGPAEGPR